MAIRFDHNPGLVAYLTAGDPTLDATRAIAIAMIDAGADVIELGVPFSDPLGDGPVIQRAMERAVARRTSLTEVLAVARDIRAARPHAGLIIFTYFNPILRYGLARFADDAAAAGADGVLVIDMIVEEAAEYLAEMERVGLAPVFLASRPLPRTAKDSSTPSRASASPESSRASLPTRPPWRPAFADGASCPWPWGLASPTRSISPRWRSLPTRRPLAAPSWS